jgi:hypothetical protein
MTPGDVFVHLDHSIRVIGQAGFFAGNMSRRAANLQYRDQWLPHERTWDDDPEKVRAAGAIDLPTIHRYLNFHFSVTIDLFGAEESSNAATFYGSGLKGRFEETKREDDHKLHGLTYSPNGRSTSASGWLRPTTTRSSHH